jgi:hypothetical protein
VTSSSFRLSPIWIEYALGCLQSDTRRAFLPSADNAWRHWELERALLAMTWEPSEITELLRLVREDREEGRAAACLLAALLPNEGVRVMLRAGGMSEPLGDIVRHNYPDGPNDAGTAALKVWMTADPPAAEAFLDTHHAVRFRASFGSEVGYRTSPDPDAPLLRIGPGEIDVRATFSRPPISQRYEDESERLVVRLSIVADDGVVWRAHVPFDAVRLLEVLRVGIYPDARRQASWTLRGVLPGAYCYSDRRQWMTVFAGDDGLQPYAYREKSLQLLVDVFAAREAREPEASDAAGPVEDLLVVRARPTEAGGAGGATSYVPAVTAAGRFLGALLLSPLGPLSPLALPVFRRTDRTGDAQPCDCVSLTRRLFVDYSSIRPYAPQLLPLLTRHYAPDLTVPPWESSPYTRLVGGNTRVRLTAPARFRVHEGGWLEMAATTAVHCTVGLRVEAASPDRVPRIGPDTTDVFVTLEVSDEHGVVYGCEQPLTAAAIIDWLRYETPHLFQSGDAAAHLRYRDTQEALSTVHVTWGEATLCAPMKDESQEGFWRPTRLSLTGMTSSASLRWGRSAGLPASGPRVLISS